jgi:multidrug resistance efflux pump
VQTEFSSVGSQIGGRVVETAVQAGSRVRRGDVLVRLDPSILQAELDQARGQYAAAQANLNALRNGPVATDVKRAQASSSAAIATYRQTLAGASDRIRAAHAAVSSDRADEQYARRQYERFRALVATGDVARQTYDEARSRYEQARMKTAQAEAQYAQLVRADLPGESQAALGNAQAAQFGYLTLRNGTRPEDVAQAQAQAKNAEASVARAQARLNETVIRAPVDGVVSSFDLHRGDMLAQNQTAAIIDAPGNPYAYIYVAQRDIERIRSAKRLVVHADSNTGTFDGHIETFDRNAQFTPQNVETADQRAELVYGMKLRINDPRQQLLPGTTVTVDVP